MRARRLQRGCWSRREPAPLSRGRACLLSVRISSAAQAEEADKAIYTPVGHERQLLWDAYADPIPLIGGAAVLAAAGPAIIRTSKQLPRRISSALRRPFRGTPGSGTTEIWDGTLEDGRVVRAAREALDAWRASSGGRSSPPAAIEPALRVAALGVAMLDFASKKAPSHRGLAVARQAAA